MNNPTAMTMVDRIIGSAPFVYEGDFLAGIAQAKDLGYDGVELHIADPADIDANSITAALDSEDLRITAFGTGRAYVNEGLSITSTNPTIHAAAMARLRKFIRLAERFQAVVIIGCMRGNVAVPEDLPAAMALLKTSMLDLDALAGKHGVTIVFEPINRYENNFLCTMEEISAFIRETGLHNTGLLIDTFHMNIEEADCCRSIRDCAPEIRYVHLADSNRLYPGGGHIPFLQILSALEKCGYSGPFSAECLPHPGKTAAAEAWIHNVRTLMAQTAAYSE